MRQMKRRKRIRATEKPNNRFAVSLAAVFFLAAAIIPDSCGARIFSLTGQTMGTIYHIRVASDTRVDTDTLKARVDVRLKMINRALSMYDPGSELSRFNRMTAGQTLTLSLDFRTVLDTGRTLHRLTGGAWDGTVKPLVDLWGFGTTTGPQTPPDREKIDTLLSCTGFSGLIIRSDTIRKDKDCLTLDLGSIAKGYGVDEISRLLGRLGYHRFLVEIGGEVFAGGMKTGQDFWKVGISRPVRQMPDQGIYKALAVKDMAIATSGSYRNFVTLNGREYSHVIHPATGFPVDNRIVSATVVAADCTFADGLATALMVMDVRQGLELVNRLDNVEALIITGSEKTGFRDRMSDNFHAYLVQ